MTGLLCRAAASAIPEHLECKLGIGLRASANEKMAWCSGGSVSNIGGSVGAYVKGVPLGGADSNSPLYCSTFAYESRLPPSPHRNSLPSLYKAGFGDLKPASINPTKLSYCIHF